MLLDKYSRKASRKVYFFNSLIFCMTPALFFVYHKGGLPVPPLRPGNPQARAYESPALPLNYLAKKPIAMTGFLLGVWQGRGLNPRPRAYEFPALPLSYLAERGEY